MIKICKECSKEFVKPKNVKKGDYCSLKCGGLGSSREKYEKYIELWKQGKVSGGKGEASGHGTVSRHVRKYIFKKYNNKCTKCNWSQINPYTGTIPLEIDHIDGDPMNHKENNLDLLCPNCHSLCQTNSTSKGNGRRYYREKYRKEVGVEGIEPPQPNDDAFTVH